jgi:ketosteroid isomerase-like protein
MKIKERNMTMRLLDQRFVGLAFCLLSLLPILTASAQTSEEKIIAKERYALDRWKTGDTFGFVDIAADEITYFDPGLEKRCTGIQAFRDHLAPAKGTFSFPDYELLNPSVQLHGDIGILTFNFSGIMADGSRDPWNTTEVYRLIDGDWKLISSHWSRTKPKS